MQTYKQIEKDLSREIVWKHSVESLTKNREQNRILSNKYIQRLWDYSFEDVLLKHNLVKSKKERFIEDWLIFSDSIYQSKKPENLKVAYFCGPEPENDVEKLTDLGVRVENIWAFENDNKHFKIALESIKGNYPTLKIINGRIESFLKTSPIVFDIIYLDFTTSLISKNSSPYKVIHDVFDHQALSDLSILITNSCFPDKNDENIEFLASFFKNQSWIEPGILLGSTIDFEDGRLMESLDCHGIWKDEEVFDLIKTNFEYAYSAFASQYPMAYSNFIQPIFRILSNSFNTKRIFETDKSIISKNIKRFEGLDDLWERPSDFSLYNFVDGLKGGSSVSGKFKKTYSDKFNGISRFEAIKLMYAYKESIYENFIEILSDSLKTAIPKLKQVIPDNRGGLFCDVPMEHLWLELAINQIGYPYHSNSLNHRRYNYIAKKREMALDIFTFDKCRAFYDWLPMVEYYIDDLSTIERQIITRSCMDAIGKHTLQNNLDELYKGSALLGILERSYSDHYNIPLREKIE